MHVVFAQYVAENQCMLSLHNMPMHTVFAQYAEGEHNMLASAHYKLPH